MSIVINNILESITIFHMCNYQFVVFGAKTLEIIFISAYQANELLFTYVINELFVTSSNIVHIMLNIEPQIKKIVLHSKKDNSINKCSCLL